MKMDDIPPPTVASKSQSENTIPGDLPPSSKTTFLTVWEAMLIIRCPVSVPPVKLTILTLGLLTSAPVTSLFFVEIILTTPSGNPTSSISCANFITAAQEDDDGFNTTVFPAAKAGAIFHADIIKG